MLDIQIDSAVFRHALVNLNLDPLAFTEITIGAQLPAIHKNLLHTSQLVGINNVQQQFSTRDSRKDLIKVRVPIPGGSV